MRYFKFFNTADSKVLLNLRNLLVRMALLPVILIVLLLSTIDMKAVPECTGHLCPETDWQSSGFTFLTRGLCTFKVDWSYRYLECIGYWCEFRLDGIEKISGPDTCLWSGNIFNVTQDAMMKVLFEEGYDTPCGVEIDSNGCKSNFSFTWGGCWMLQGSSPTTGDSLSIPCADRSVCCWSTWELCKINGVKQRPTKIAHIGLNPVCSINCIGVCEYFPPPTPSNIEENVNHENGFKTFVFPNPSSDIINIKLISNTDGEHQIEVFDIAGNLILTQNLNKQQNEELIQLKMGNYSNGTYNYVIKHNGVPGINGSFKLLK